MMKFKTKKLKIDSEKFDIKEINARQRQELFKLFKDETDPVEAQAHAIKMGCSQFQDMAIDEILDMPGTVFASLAEEVMNISGLGDKSEKDEVKNS